VKMSKELPGQSAREGLLLTPSARRSWSTRDVAVREVSMGRASPPDSRPRNQTPRLSPKGDTAMPGRGPCADRLPRRGLRFYRSSIGGYQPRICTASRWFAVRWRWPMP
jgi:hypothetical protein